jgi:hypothetical protein
MWVLHLGLGLHIRFASITYGLFKMNLHAGIAFRPWSSFKSTPKLHIGYFKATLHVGIAFKVALSLEVNPKSPMGYFEMNLNIAIAFKVGASYNFAISIDVLIITN